MVDVNPEIWDNETLGAAAYNERLDRLEKQQHEDRIAKVEGREPREVVVDNTYPGFQFDQNTPVPSNATVVHFADEQPHEVIQTGNGVIPEGMDEDETNTEPEESDPSSPVEENDPNVDDDPVQGEDVEAEDESGASVDSPPEAEGNSTQWN